MSDHPVPRGMSRTTIMAGWGFPIYYLPPIILLPVIVATIAGNPLWLFGIVGLAGLVRAFCDGKDGDIYLKWLRYKSGSTFASLENGVEVDHPLKASSNDLGLLND